MLGVLRQLLTKVYPDKTKVEEKLNHDWNAPRRRQTEKFKQGVKWVISESLQRKLDMVETKAILSELFVRTEVLHSGIHYKFSALSGKTLKFSEVEMKTILSCCIPDGLTMVY